MLRSKGGLAQVAGEKRFLLFDPGAAEGRGAERRRPADVAASYPLMLGATRHGDTP